MCKHFGPQYTRDNPYQASQRLWQSRWRLEFTNAGYERYGNYLDTESAQSGINFLSPEIFKAVKKRADAGKGIDYEMITENLLTSQALCFNYFVPLQNDLALASRILSNLFPFIDKCIELEIEYTPPNYLNDQGRKYGVDADVAIRFQHIDSTTGILLLEVKYTEQSFSRCSHREHCPYGVSPISDFEKCIYSIKNKYRYWEYTRSGTFNLEKIKTFPTCPFTDSLKQLWTNQVLAEAVMEHENLAHSHFAVIYPEENHALTTEPLSGRSIFESYSGFLTTTETFSHITWKDLCNTTAQCLSSADHRNWFQRFSERYRGLLNPETIYGKRSWK